MVHSDERLEGARQIIEQIYDEHDLFIIHADLRINQSTLEIYKEVMTRCRHIEFISEEKRLKGKWASWVSLWGPRTSRVESTLSTDACIPLTALAGPGCDRDAPLGTRTGLAGTMAAHRASRWLSLAYRKPGLSSRMAASLRLALKARWLWRRSDSLPEWSV